MRGPGKRRMWVDGGIRRKKLVKGLIPKKIDDRNRWHKTNPNVHYFVNGARFFYLAVCISFYRMEYLKAELVFRCCKGKIN